MQVRRGLCGWCDHAQGFGYRTERHVTPRPREVTVDLTGHRRVAGNPQPRQVVVAYQVLGLEPGLVGHHLLDQPQIAPHVHAGGREHANTGLEGGVRVRPHRALVGVGPGARVRHEGKVHPGHRIAIGQVKRQCRLLACAGQHLAHRFDQLILRDRALRLFRLLATRRAYRVLLANDELLARVHLLRWRIVRVFFLDILYGMSQAHREIQRPLFL